MDLGAGFIRIKTLVFFYKYLVIPKFFRIFASNVIFTQIKIWLNLVGIALKDMKVQESASKHKSKSMASMNAIMTSEIMEAAVAKS